MASLRWGQRKHAVLLLLFSLLAFSGSQEANAHVLNNGYSNLIVGEQEIRYELLLPQSTLLSYDTDEDRRLSSSELQEHSKELEAYLRDQSASSVRWTAFFDG